jgi:hypothetical protein
MYEEKMKEREGDGKGEKRHRSSEAATIVAREKKVDTTMQKDL